MHLILREFLDRINEHHKQIPDSSVGVDEIRRIGRETDFVRIGTEPVQNTRSLYAMFKAHDLPMFQCLDSMEVVIERQLKARDHPMPVEFALNTLAPAIPKLNPAILRRLPLKTWSEWFEASGLEPIFEKLEADIAEQLKSAPATQPTSGAMSPRTTYTARGRQPSVVGSPAESHDAMVTKAVQGALDQEPAASSPFNSLFDSESQAPQDLRNVQSARPEKPFPKLILPGYAARPAPVPQGRAPKTAAPINPLPDQLAVAAPAPQHGVSRPPNPSQSQQTNAPGFLGHLRNALGITTTQAGPSTAIAMTPVVPDNGSEYTGQSTPAERHATGAKTIYFPADHNLKGQRQNITQAGMPESAADTAARLKDARMKFSQTPDEQDLGSGGHKSAEGSIKSSALDRDGDSTMNGGYKSESEESEEL